MFRNSRIIWVVFAILLALVPILYLYISLGACTICLAAAITILIIYIRRLIKLLNDSRKQDEAFRALADNEAKAHKDELAAMSKSNHEALEEFRSLMSHQLRMPLSIVQGYAGLLEKDIITNEEMKKEYLGKIVDRTQYISEILTKRLASCRASDEIALEFSRFDIIALLRQIGEDMQTVAKNHGINIQTISTLDSLYIEGDFYQISKVIFNILENSLKYMGREGHVTIMAEASGTFVNITIKDDGLGLGEEQTQYIFEMNFQGSNKTIGHGHGLYLAKTAIESQGGTISAQSSQGMGMTIKISLPISQSVENSQELEHSVCPS
ncbi:MAG: HAMP domain-containing histidine kinase [Clostridiales bacterium]|nr:HAMP domain-containing histidine kinase [Clostridiales bacterium]